MKNKETEVDSNLAQQQSERKILYNDDRSGRDLIDFQLTRFQENAEIDFQYINP